MIFFLNENYDFLMIFNGFLKMIFCMKIYVFLMKK